MNLLDNILDIIVLSFVAGVTIGGLIVWFTVTLWEMKE